MLSFQDFSDQQAEFTRVSLLYVILILEVHTLHDLSCNKLQ